MKKLHISFILLMLTAELSVVSIKAASAMQWADYNIPVMIQEGFKLFNLNIQDFVHDKIGDHDATDETTDANGNKTTYFASAMIDAENVIFTKSPSGSSSNNKRPAIYVV